MDYTVVRNYPGTDDEPGHINWRKRFGGVQLLCPKCFEWFKLPKDIKIDKNGCANTSFYHFCEDEDGNDNGGWVATVQLDGWEK